MYISLTVTLYSVKVVSFISLESVICSGRFKLFLFLFQVILRLDEGIGFPNYSTILIVHAISQFLCFIFIFSLVIVCKIMRRSREVGMSRH